jgi:Cytochrome P450
MVLNPEVQLKAQNELDSIIGFDRLPTLEDRPSLPYIERVMQETFRCAHQILIVSIFLEAAFIPRWHPVVPLGKDSDSFAQVLPLTAKSHRYTSQVTRQRHL